MHSAKKVITMATVTKVKGGGGWCGSGTSSAAIRVCVIIFLVLSHLVVLCHEILSCQVTPMVFSVVFLVWFVIFYEVARRTSHPSHTFLSRSRQLAPARGIKTTLMSGFLVEICLNKRLDSTTQKGECERDSKTHEGHRP